MTVRVSRSSDDHEPYCPWGNRAKTFKSVSKGVREPRRGDNHGGAYVASKNNLEEFIKRPSRILENPAVRMSSGS